MLNEPNFRIGLDSVIIRVESSILVSYTSRYLASRVGYSFIILLDQDIIEAQTYILKPSKQQARPVSCN